MASREDTIDGMVTWWDVEGASWTDEDGIPTKIRSFPAVVPADPGGFVTPPGYVREGLSDPALVTQALADAARNVREISTGAPHEWETARYIGKPALLPGQVVSLTSELLELSDAKRWVMSVQHSADDRGIRTTWAGWTGSGSAVPAGNDAATVTVFTSPRHVGDEYLSYYAVPNPEWLEISFTITVPDTYTALVLSGEGHGCNSYLIDGANAESEVSKIEVWQGGDKPVGTATLPTMPENYGASPTWQSFRLPVPGRLTPGVATVKLLSGQDRRIPDAYTNDDYEIRNLVLTLTGVGVPVLPTGGT